MRNFLLFLTMVWMPDFLLASSVDADGIRGVQSRRPVSVLQQRFFEKSNRIQFGLNTSMILREAYNDTFLTGLHLSYFLKESLGFELNINQSHITDSDDYNALRSLSYRPVVTDTADPDRLVSVDPERNRIHSMTDLGVVFAPFYGKFNILDENIVYADFLFLTGLTSLKTDQGQKIALNLGFGEAMYFMEQWSIKFLYRSRFFQEERSQQKYTRHIMNLSLNLGYML
ncbi:MAG: outer membrane beta-barrel domain-containing protein [Oligoflexales bacterium]